jgi:hypothetical protein
MKKNHTKEKEIPKIERKIRNVESWFVLQRC